jgi:integrase
MEYPTDLHPDPICFNNRSPLDLDGFTMPADLVHRPQQLPLALPKSDLASAGTAADAAAGRRVFDDYRARLADETARRHDAELGCFASFLAAAGVSTHLSTDLSSGPAGWAGVSWGLIAAFVEWQLAEGYAIGSINVRLSTVKVYAKLATKAGSVAPEEYALIKLVSGYRHAEGKRIDRQRERTRKGSKKGTPTSISTAQVAQLKAQADPRDRLLMCLLLDHGLRIGEVAALLVEHFDLDRGVLTFYRSKVDKTQKHRLSKDTHAAAIDYLASLDAGGRIFPVVDRTLRTGVGELGQACGLDHLSPHDCRHAWATAATRNGTPIKALQDAGGWNSPTMPLRYAESAEIANDGVRLD